MTTRTLLRGESDTKRLFDPERRALDPYCHEAAMDELLGRDTPALARDTGYGASTMKQWRRKHDSDHRGPGRALAIVFRAAHRLGRPWDVIVEVVRAILEDSGAPYDLCPRVPVAGTVGAATAGAELAGLAAVQKVANGVHRIAAMAADGLSEQERIEARRLARGMREQLAAYEAQIEQESAS